ncbi:hypothetical protein FB451DRAFT_1369762 [Mycena latifolia]|nr:hypothetical protein FB451DRAFT_1369762 [Mycena latifolia]
MRFTTVVSFLVAITAAYAGTIESRQGCPGTKVCLTPTVLKCCKGVNPFHLGCGGDTTYILYAEEWHRKSSMQSDLGVVNVGDLGQSRQGWSSTGAQGGCVELKLGYLMSKEESCELAGKMNAPIKPDSRDVSNVRFIAGARSEGAQAEREVK